MTSSFAIALMAIFGTSPLPAPDSLVVPMLADTAVEVEAGILPPAGAALPLYYQIAWGDGDTLNWTEPLRSAVDISRYHLYKTPGDYAISVRAKDSLGRVSAWSKHYSVKVWPEPMQKGMFPTDDPIVASPTLDLHGNIYVGDESGSFHSISAASGRERWAFKAGDAIYGSAAVSGDRVYVCSLDSNLYCLDTTGKRHWSLNLGDAIYCTPAIGADGTVYVTTDSGKVAAVAPDGKKKWSIRAGDEIAGSPTIGPNGLIYVTSDSVYCLDPRGHRRWAYGTPEGEYFYASAIVDANDTVYVGNTDGYLYCLGPDGRQQWRTPVPDGDEVRPEVVVGPDGAFYFGTDGDYLLRKTPQGTPTVEYEAEDILVGTAAASDKGTVYFLPDDGTLYALTANGRMLWTRQVATGHKDVYYTSAPTIAPDGTVYVGSWDGGLYAFRGDGPAANTLWPQHRHDAQHTGRVSKPLKDKTR